MPMLSKHFDEIDANKDGKVTPEELKAMMGKIHADSPTGQKEKAPEKK